MSTTSEIVERLKTRFDPRIVQPDELSRAAALRLDELERDNARLTSEVEKITRWANASLDSVKAVMWSYETALLNIEGHLSNHIETHKKVDVAIAVAYETARAALAGSGEK